MKFWLWRLFFLINPFSYSYVLVGIIMVYISLSLLKLLYWLIWSNLPWTYFMPMCLRREFDEYFWTSPSWIHFCALNFELNLFCLFYLLFCSKNYVGTLRLLVAPQADASTILSQTHGIFNQVFYFFWKYLKVHSEPSRGFAMEFFVKTISGFQPLTVFA